MSDYERETEGRITSLEVRVETHDMVLKELRLHLEDVVKEIRSTKNMVVLLAVTAMGIEKAWPLIAQWLGF